MSDSERIAALVDELGSWMYEAGLSFHYCMDVDTWEEWATQKVEDFHEHVGLNLDLYAECDMGTIGHDINGICSYWDMESHKMRDCFLPRCAR